MFGNNANQDSGDVTAEPTTDGSEATAAEGQASPEATVEQPSIVASGQDAVAATDALHAAVAANTGAPAPDAGAQPAQAAQPAQPTQYRVLNDWFYAPGKKSGFKEGDVLSVEQAKSKGDIDELVYIGVIEPIEPAPAETAPASDNQGQGESQG
jgi:hypothetical protein